jgi:hypothetical protein
MCRFRSPRATHRATPGDDEVKLTIDLDPAGGLHLAHALGAHRRYCDEYARAYPVVASEPP